MPHTIICLIQGAGSIIYNDGKPIIKSRGRRIQKKKLRRLTESYQTQPNRGKQKKRQQKKKKLKEAYLNAEEREIDELVRQEENADEQSKHKQSWKIMNQKSGWKKTRK